MFLELIATVFAGLAAAGVVLLVNRLLGNRLPNWIVPVCAGLGMIATTISNEYSWYSRTAANLPDGLSIAQTVENKSYYQPWTFLIPYIDRFVAVDINSTLINPDIPHQRMIDIYFFGRWYPANKMRVLLDCQHSRRAQLITDANFDKNGHVVDPPWVGVTPTDPVLKMGCGVS